MHHQKRREGGEVASGYSNVTTARFPHHDADIDEPEQHQRARLPVAELDDTSLEAEVLVPSRQGSRLF